MPHDAVSVADLGALGPRLGHGAQAEVFALPGLRLPDAPTSLVYKRYKPDQNPPKGLRRLVKVRNNLDPAAQARLDLCAAWPLRVVEEGGQVRGAVMSLIPDSYMQTRTLPGTGERKTSPREVQNLLVSAERARVVGMPYPTDEQRLAICRDLAAALHLLHRNGLVFGDLNARNELFRLGDDRPSVMLVDCDGARISGSVETQLNAPDWDAPDRWLSMSSDRYKFGLFVLRCLTPGDQASTTRDPARCDHILDAVGRHLIRASLSERPADRPTAQQWGRHLQALLTGQPTTALPTVAAVTVPPPRKTTAGGWVRDKVTGQWTRR